MFGMLEEWLREQLAGPPICGLEVYQNGLFHSRLALMVDEATATYLDWLISDQFPLFDFVVYCGELV